MIKPPLLPDAPPVYEMSFFNVLSARLRDYFERANASYPHRASTLNININTLPTEAALATLASGDVYRDTTASNVLKVKP